MGTTTARTMNKMWGKGVVSREVSIVPELCTVVPFVFNTADSIKNTDFEPRNNLFPVIHSPSISSKYL